MDVASSETLTEMHSGLYVVLLFVGVAQGFQAYNGFVLLQAFVSLDKAAHWWEYKEEIQVCFTHPHCCDTQQCCFIDCFIVMFLLQLVLLGVSFLILAVFNFWNTLATVLEKRRKTKPTAPAGIPRVTSRPSFDPAGTGSGMHRVSSRPNFDPTGPGANPKKEQ